MEKNTREKRYLGITCTENFHLRRHVQEAIEQITKRMIGPHQSVAAEEIYELWLEYEKYETNESIVVHDLDKYEMILQAFEYEARYPELNLQGFFDSTKDYFRTDLVKNWSLQLREKRMKRP